MIELDDLKAALRVKDTDADRDTHLVALEAAAVQFVQNYTGRYFGASGSVTEYVRGAGHERLWLAEAPASLPATLEERAAPGDDATTITAANADGYVLRDGLCLVRKGGGVWARGYEYAVTYTRGFSAGAEPADIRQAVTGLVLHWYQHRYPVSSTVGINTAEVPLHVREILNGWRRPSWGHP